MTVFRNKQRDGEWRYDFWRRKQRYAGPCLDPLTGEPVTTKTAAIAVETAKKAEADRQPNHSAGRSDVPAGQYTLLQAGAAHVRRLVDRQRNLAHIENNRLYVAEIIGFFGRDHVFRDLTQASVDAYAKFARAQTLKTWLGGRRSRTDEDLSNPELWRDTGKPRSIRTANNYLKCFKGLLARAAKVRDPFTKDPAVDPAIEIEMDRPPKRKPRPMADHELYEREKHLMPWAKEAAELSRMFGLRKTEALTVQTTHIDAYAKGLYFKGEQTKSGHDERATGGRAGWAYLQKLQRQAERRGTTYLITWPGAAFVHLLDDKKAMKEATWLPLKSLGSSWRKSGKRAGIADPRRYHDIRGRFVTEVAKANRAAAQGAARHQSAAT